MHFDAPMCQHLSWVDELRMNVNLRRMTCLFRLNGGQGQNRTGNRVGPTRGFSVNSIGNPGRLDAIEAKT